MAEAKKEDEILDVAIVGGGVSGVYTGWRLLTADLQKSEKLRAWAAENNGKLRVALFEGSNRIGGRLLSARPPGFSDTTTCEIGGMRYVSAQTLVRSLVENELNLPHYEQIVDQECNIMYLRGQQLRFQQKNDPVAMPYNLTWAEKQFILEHNPSGLIGWAIAKMLPVVNSVTPKELPKALQSARIDGTKLYKQGFWNLLARAMSPDAYEAARTLVGYDCLGSNANAVDLICEYFDFTPDVHYYLLKDGYDSVPWQLEKRFKENKGEVFLKEWVGGFDSKELPDGSTGVELHFRGGRSPVTARAVILAMPKRSLELLDREGPVFGPLNAPDVQKLIGSVRAIPLYKLFVAYDYPWWQAVDVSQGRTLTDTAVRQLYYWPVDPSAPSPPKTGKALLMAYNDATNVDFWEGLSGASRSDDALGHLRRLLPFLGLFSPQGQESKPTSEFTQRMRQNWDEHRAPPIMIKEMHRQIMRIHNVEYAPDPIDAAYMDWSIDPYGGGVHFWNRGYKSWEVLHEITHPVKDFPCYICGEAYSTNQTWVEGALQTAEIVLREHLGLGEPTWITPNPEPDTSQSAMEQKLLQVQAVKDVKSSAAKAK